MSRVLRVMTEQDGCHRVRAWGEPAAFGYNAKPRSTRSERVTSGGPRLDTPQPDGVRFEKRREQKSDGRYVYYYSFPQKSEAERQQERERRDV